MHDHPRKSQGDSEKGTSNTLSKLGSTVDKQLGTEMESSNDEGPHGHVVNAKYKIGKSNTKVSE